MYSVLIKNGKVIDGSGKEGKVMDVAIEGDEIALVDENIETEALTVIDASGKVVAPGFIDVQNHSDSYWTLFDNPNLDSLITQGFTTILVGQCGASLAPLISPESLLAVQKWHGLSGSNINWTTFSQYLEELSKTRFGCNVASLVGYATLRRGMVGNEVRVLTKDEVKSISIQLENCLEAGAFGMSSGLSYSHEMNISELELFDLVQIVSKHGGLFSIHLRDESKEIIESVEEALEIARHTDVNLKISHLKIRGKENFHLLSQLVENLENAYHKGVNVNFDCYPYDSIWQVAYSYLPKWSIEGGRQGMLQKIAEPQEKKRLIAALAEHGNRLQELIIASTGNELGMVGKTVSDIAKNTGLTSEEAFLELVKNGGSESLVFDRCLNEGDIYKLLEHPQSLVGTDGSGFNQEVTGKGFLKKLVHPRCFGTAPRFINHVLNSSIGMESAIKKLTFDAATKIGIKKRGLLAPNHYADVVVFDPEKISDRASLKNPYQYSSGMDFVLVNGVISIDNGQITKKPSGYVLRKK